MNILEQSDNASIGEKIEANLQSRQTKESDAGIVQREGLKWKRRKGGEFTTIPGANRMLSFEF